MTRFEPSHEKTCILLADQLCCNRKPLTILCGSWPWLYSLVCVGPGLKPQRKVFSRYGSFNIVDTEMVCQEVHPLVGQNRVGSFRLSYPLVHNILQQSVCEIGTVATSLPEDMVYLWCVLRLGGNAVVGVSSHSLDI